MLTTTSWSLSPFLHVVGFGFSVFFSPVLFDFCFKFWFLFFYSFFYGLSLSCVGFFLLLGRLVSLFLFYSFLLLFRSSYSSCFFIGFSVGFSLAWAGSSLSLFQFCFCIFIMGHRATGVFVWFRGLWDFFYIGYRYGFLGPYCYSSGFFSCVVEYFLFCLIDFIVIMYRDFYGW